MVTSSPLLLLEETPSPSRSRKASRKARLRGSIRRSRTEFQRLAGDRLFTEGFGRTNQRLLRNGKLAQVT
ncbi:hypothetical protein AAFF_G00149490 [Aldrovandia affinis]|uniref:Uncharacterized protein n=1 Tax=Aldrovandia affinis TaxID=143900 RepID=A0AAD7RPC7_9TELE|nr:hypothetical protein AAFF_G00149490 [Aldrovandia affinis]